MQCRQSDRDAGERNDGRAGTLRQTGKGIRLCRLRLRDTLGRSLDLGSRDAGGLGDRIVVLFERGLSLGALDDGVLIVDQELERGRPERHLAEPFPPVAAL